MRKSFLHAMAGIAAAVKGERNMRIHLAAAVVAILLGAWLGLSACEWASIMLCIALVVSLECANTAIEAAVDLASPDIHPLAKKAKDCAAGAVLLAAMGAAIVGCIIFAPKVFSLIVGK
jgi:diacylglycerol kinase (ATP)